LLWLGLASAASAQMAPPQPPKLENLDLVAIESDVIVTGTVASYRPEAQAYEASPVEFDVRETLKGAPGGTAKVMLDQGAKDFAEWRSSRTPFLIAIGEKRTRFYNLNDPKTILISGELVLLDGAETILAELRKSIARARGPDRGSFGVFVRRARYMGTRIEKRYWTGDYTVQVPIDERLEARAHQALRSGLPAARVNAVQALQFFPSVENLARLRASLRDPYWAHSTYVWGDQLRTFRYAPVRREASRVLRELGHYVSVPFSDPPDGDGRVVWAAFGNRPISSLAWAALPRYRNLQNLYLSGAALTPAQFQSLRRLKSLRRIFLEGSNVTDSDLAVLATLPRLEYVSLMNTRVTEVGLRLLAGIPALRRVDMPIGISGSLLAAARPKVQLRKDPFASFADLKPRRIESPPGPLERFFYAGYPAPPGPGGLRQFRIIFPKEHAAVAEARMREYLLATGRRDQSFERFFHFARPGRWGPRGLSESVLLITDPDDVRVGEKAFYVLMSLEP
jgi:hypothetical protein